MGRWRPTLLHKLVRVVEHRAFEVPVGLSVLSRYRPAELRLRHPSPPPLRFSDGPLYRALFARYPESRLEPVRLDARAPAPAARRFVEEQMRLMQVGGLDEAGAFRLVETRMRRQLETAGCVYFCFCPFDSSSLLVQRRRRQRARPFPSCPPHCNQRLLTPLIITRNNNPTTTTQQQHQQQPKQQQRKKNSDAKAGRGTLLSQLQDAEEGVLADALRHQRRREQQQAAQREQREQRQRKQRQAQAGGGGGGR